MARRMVAAVVAAVLVLGSAGAAAGADATVSTVKGQKYRMADAIIADTIHVFTDPTGDQTHTDGSGARGAPKWSDIVAVRTAMARTPAKLRSKMESLHPPGATDAFYGSAARPRVT